MLPRSVLLGKGPSPPQDVGMRSAQASVGALAPHLLLQGLLLNSSRKQLNPSSPNVSLLVRGGAGYQLLPPCPQSTQTHPSSPYFVTLGQDLKTLLCPAGGSHGKKGLLSPALGFGLSSAGVLLARSTQEASRATPRFCLGPCLPARPPAPTAPWPRPRPQAGGGLFQVCRGGSTVPLFRLLQCPPRPWG